MEMNVSSSPSSLLDNTTTNATFCQTQPDNSYCGIYNAGRIFEIVYLAFIILIGTFGNLLVVFSIIFDKRVYSQGNVFIINLAVADLIVTGFFLPSVLANVIETENALPTPLCDAAGYLITVTCAVSVCDLMFIAINRYWVVVHAETFPQVFSNRHMVLMVLFTWLWSNLIVSPTLFGWSSLIYDYKMEQCGWDDRASVAYNVLLMVCAIFIPVTVIVYCYWAIYKYVKHQGNWFRKQSRKERSANSPAAVARNISSRSHSHKHIQREIRLLKTLAVTVVIFLICWLPYGTIILFFVETVPPIAKKIAARLGLSNSAMNFIVYGVMHPTYRKGYKNFIMFLMCRRSRTQIRSMRESKFTTRRDQTRYQSCKHKKSQNHLTPPRPYSSVR